MSYACEQPGGAWTAGQGGDVIIIPTFWNWIPSPKTALTQGQLTWSWLKIITGSKRADYTKVTTSGCECSTITEANTYEVCGYVTTHEIHWNIGSHWIPANMEHHNQVIDVAIPSNTNIKTKEHKELKKKEELEKMWKVKDKVVPVVIGALSAITPKQEQERLRSLSRRGQS